MLSRAEIIEELDFPFYEVCEEGVEGLPTSRDIEPYYAGRLIMSHCSAAPAFYATLDSLDELKAILTKNDVVWIQLYKGNLGQSDWPLQKVDDYGRRIGFIEEIAPLVGGILTGNQGPEMSYRPRPSHENIRLLCEFIDMTAPVILDLGGTPFYAPMDLDIMQDCYQTDGMLLRKLNDVGATSIVYCGFTMLPGAYCDPKVPIFAETLKQAEVVRGGQSPELLKDYLKETNIWSDVAGDIGLRKGNGSLVKSWGFKAAIIGAF